MEIKNRLIRRNVPFEEYLKIPGFSHSDIKNDFQKMTATPKMQLGTAVHNYLLEGELYDHSDRDIVVPAANALEKAIGSKLLDYLEPEICVTCDMTLKGLTLKYRGRIDLCIIGRLVVDIKLSDMPLAKGVDLFGYDNQLSGYAIGSDARAAVIVRLAPSSIKKGRDPVTEIRNIGIKKDWWAYNVLKYGKP